MPRSKWKEPFQDKSLERKLAKLKRVSAKKGIDPTKISILSYSRSSTITEEFVGLMFQIHTGNSFKKVRITQEMVGHKFGEFAPTKKSPDHPKSKKGKK